MEPGALKELQELLEAGLSNATVEVEGDEHSMNVNVVGDVFEGLSKVKRQQKVYGLIKHLIASGNLHAVTMKTLTPSEQEG
jgi:acid stress-induced BolA-like protein IbaG/YrbA